MGPARTGTRFQVTGSRKNPDAKARMQNDQTQRSGMSLYLRSYVKMQMRSAAIGSASSMGISVKEEAPSAAKKAAVAASTSGY